eukprot:m.15737 g.15737  ORF g.15737 m.15737 type:complete len:207 (+) comp7906_c0_seq1:40-660(+)
MSPVSALALLTRRCRPPIFSRSLISLSHLSVYPRPPSSPRPSILGSKASRAKMSSTYTPKTPSSVQKTDQEWKEILSEKEYYVLREKGTERAGTGEYDKFYPKKGEGFFACRGCGNPLYSAEAKFKSGCGWPAFDKCYKGAVKTHIDNTYGMRRVEIVCAACDGHLGHVFEGERFTETNERHCVNSISVKFVEGPEPEGLVEAKVV